MDAPAILRVFRGPDAGLQVPVTGRITIGRGGGSFHLSDRKVSRLHAVLAVTPEGVTIADMGSTGGTRLNGRRVTDAEILPPGGVVGVGDSLLRLLTPRRSAQETVAPAVELRDPEGGIRRVPVAGRVVIGRSAADADVVVDSRAVSRRHLELELRGGSLLARDLGSSNGAAVNGRRLEEPRALMPGDEVELLGSGWSIRIREPGESSDSAREVRVRAESEGSARAVRIDGGGASIGAVARRVAAFLGVPSSPATTLYSAEDGTLFDPSDAWASAGVRRAETLVVADVEFPRAASTDPRPPGARVVNVPPRTSIVPAPQRFTAPRVPEPADLRGRGLPWQLGGGALGVIGGIVLGAATGNWLFAVLGATAGFGTIVFGVLAEQSRRRHLVRRFREQLADLGRSVGDAADRQADEFRQEVLDPDSWNSVVASPRLWERRPSDSDFLRLALGTGRRRALVDVVLRPAGEPSKLESELDAVRTDRHLDDVPVLGPPGGILAVVGPRRRVRELAAHVLVEAALTCPPSALGITVLAGSDEWDWVRWLPHVLERGAPELAREPADVASLAAAVGRREGERRRLVVVGAGMVDRSIDLIRSWTAEDGLILVLAEDLADVPAEAERAIVLAGESATVTVPYVDGPVGAFRPAELDLDEAERAAIALGRLIDPRQPSDTALGAAGLLDLVGVRRDGGIDPAALWREVGGKGLTAVLGRADSGEPVAVDLRTDGPHAMVAGTTGSGKSELLASMLASLLARYSPEHLTLFLIDFKGGATFGRFRGLPHVAGVVTDLQGDEQVTRRAFLALDAELSRRKAVLAAAGVSDLGAYRRAGSPRGPLSSLVVVIDEFALLVQSQPAIKERLDVVAAQGRSLGVHLVLATQSPGGVITPKIRANTNLWLALRVVSETESRELVGSDAAARLPAASPGRALVRRGAETSTTAFQTARVTVSTAGDAEAAVVIAPFADAAPSAAVAPVPESSTVESDLDRLLEAVQAAAVALRYPPAAPLWLPPLPARVLADDLPDSERTGTLPVVLGLADRPAEQRQEPFAVDLAAMNLLVTGGPGSGRTSALLRVAADLAESLPPSRVHLYGIDVGGSLAPLEALPHTAGVVRVDDAELLPRLMGRLMRIVGERRSQGAPREPRIVLLVDDYNVVREALEGGANPRLPELFATLLSGGRAAGLSLAMATSAPTDLRISLAGSFGHRVQLRTTERSDYLAIEWRPDADALPPALPGRAMVTGPREVQLVLPDLERAAALASAWAEDGAPRRIERLPARIPLASLAAGGAIGLSGDDLQPVTLEARAGAHVVVLGEPGSGRSTALATLAAAHLTRPGGTLAVLSWRPGPLDAVVDRAFAVARTPAEADRVLAAVEGAPDGCLLVLDDAEELPPALGDRLERLLRSGRATGMRAAVSARAAEWGRLFDPWVRYLGSLGTAIVLSRLPEIAPAFGVRPQPPFAPPAPGRGFLIADGTVAALQLATLDSVTDPAHS